MVTSWSLPRTFPDLLPIFLCSPPVAPGSELTPSYYYSLCPLDCPQVSLVACRVLWPLHIWLSWAGSPGQCRPLCTKTHRPLTQSPVAHRARQHLAVVKTVTLRVRACGSIFLPHRALAGWLSTSYLTSLIISFMRIPREGEHLKQCLMLVNSYYLLKRMNLP